MASKFVSSKVLSVHEQLARMRGMFPRFRSRVQDGALIATGDIQPTSLSPTYRVRLQYRAGSAPDVIVLSPALRPREPAGRLKHVYAGNRLCLYLPGADEWTPDQSLAHTVVPWICEWLFYYEMWHATGVWLGGGVEPTEPVTIRKEETQNERSTSAAISHPEP
jgi:hypothetical protein